MAGGTPEHAALAAAAITLLGPQLRGGEGRPYNSDLRVRTPTGLTTYPDVTVICGPREINDVDPLAITNPTLIVEVLSRSTEEQLEGHPWFLGAIASTGIPATGPDSFSSAVIINCVSY